MEVSDITLSLPSRSLDRPPPLIVESPRTNRNAFVLLHGTSSSGAPFSKELMEQIDFGLLLPRTKLVFPSGSLRKTTVFGGNLTHAWFDIADFADRTKGEEQQKEGLKESIEYLGKLIKDVVDSESDDEKFQVFVGGLSQGCAMSMILLLSGQLDELRVSQKLGGFVGLSGWLPFERQLSGVIMQGRDWKEKRALAQCWLRSELGLSLSERWDMPSSSSWKKQDITIFLAHGTSDEKVRMEWGENMRRLLEAVGFKVEWKEYEGMGHVTIPGELVDMTDFIKHESDMHDRAGEETIVTSPHAPTPTYKE
ncbi:hypothetical protein MFRU_005g01270 [Monilinia fructicola]|uniref:Phospholipase/carboxylesterase/thioesterase domain-containing protein n=1 Tax=Monilinia fructicola TaxID=38448 RepID=A0A5M9JPN1_MONFR|nr:hypothetical protein EYC84_002307 [Monilinia fructicola]KAG4033110.1 hypothetical protein MFRU_005g01270 [Monilinia fructicola]